MKIRILNKAEQAEVIDEISTVDAVRHDIETKLEHYLLVWINDQLFWIDKSCDTVEKVRAAWLRVKIEGEKK